MQILRAETGKILVEAHRTAQANSWTGLLAAAEAGADVVEVDVQLSADEVPVLHHDYRLPGGAFLRSVAAEALRHIPPEILPAPPPRLDEVLDWVMAQPQIHLMLDIKNGFGQGVRPFQRTLAAVQAAGAEGRVMVTAWDHMGLLWTKRHAPTIRTKAILRGNVIDLVAVAKRAEVDMIALSYDLIDRADIESLHEAGIGVMLAELWEPNFRYPVTLGVDMVSWDDPAEAIFALEQQGAR